MATNTTLTHAGIVVHGSQKRGGNTARIAVLPLKNNRKEMNDMAYEYRKLIGRIIEICGTRAEFAKRMGLSEKTISLKLNGKIDWKQSEILKAAEILGIDDSEIQEYFFTLKVH